MTMSAAEAAGVILGAIALLVAVISVALLIVVELLKRPRLEIRPADWPYQAPWKFAVVHVFNRPGDASRLRVAHAQQRRGMRGHA